MTAVSSTTNSSLNTRNNIYAINNSNINSIITPSSGGHRGSSDGMAVMPQFAHGSSSAARSRAGSSWGGQHPTETSSNILLSATHQLMGYRRRAQSKANSLKAMNVTRESGTSALESDDFETDGLRAAGGSSSKAGGLSATGGKTAGAKTAGAKTASSSKAAAGKGSASKGSASKTAPAALLRKGMKPMMR